MARPGVSALGHRQVLENLWGGGRTVTEIAEVLAVSASTVCRELDRNHSGRHGTKNPLPALLATGGVGVTGRGSGHMGAAAGGEADAAGAVSVAGSRVRCARGGEQVLDARAAHFGAGGRDR